MRETHDTTIDRQIAARLKALRQAQGWSLEALALRSGVSRATLSRLENAEVSATAAVLGRLATAHGMTISRLMALAEDEFLALVRAGAQPVWRDPETGQERRQLSPPARLLAGEVIACRLPPATDIAYDAPPRPGLEHHILLQAGALAVTVAGVRHELTVGDCLRYQLGGPARFETPAGSEAAYLIFIV